jgi:hypothetical protein
MQPFSVGGGAGRRGEKAQEVIEKAREGYQR